MKLSLRSSLLRSCVSIWTAGSWTGGWASVSFCCTFSSSSAPWASRGCRGTPRTHTPTQRTHTQLVQLVFQLHLLPFFINVEMGDFFFTLWWLYMLKQRYYDTGFLKATCLPLITEYFTVLYRAPAARTQMHYALLKTNVLRFYSDTKNSVRNPKVC